MHIVNLLMAASCFLSIAYSKREVVVPTDDCGYDYAEGDMQSCGDRPGHCTLEGKPWPACLIKDDKNIGREFCNSDAGWTIVLDKGEGKKATGGKKCSTLKDEHNEPYRWVHDSYTWDCCKCPKGYQPAGYYDPRIDGIGGFTYNLTKGLVEKTCMRCTEPAEKLVFDKTRQQWSCRTAATPTHHPTHTPTHTHTTKTHKPTHTPGGGGSTAHCRTNPAGIQLIEAYTGAHPAFYSWDGTNMIGYAHNCTLFADCGDLVPPLSAAAQASLLTADLTRFETCVAALPNAAGLNANQFAALVAFASSYLQSCEGMAAAFTALMQKEDFGGVCDAMRTTNLNGEVEGEFDYLRGWQADLCEKKTTVMSGC